MRPIAAGDELVAMDDVRNVLTVEENLRLLDAIAHLGLGKWMDISEEVTGTSGRTSKTSKNCMERYSYDYIGTYGLILPQYTSVEVPEGDRKSIMAGDGEIAIAEGDTYAHDKARMV